MRRKSKSVKGPSPCQIGVDLLGSDLPPNDLLKAIFAFSKDLGPKVQIVLFGTPALFQRKRPPSDNISFHLVSEVITMEDAPLTAIRRKKDSSICQGINMLKEGHLQAFISAGNTGALLACAALQLPSLHAVQRPALLTLFPTKERDIAVLDVGANTSYKAEHLVQFAAMGIAYQKSRGIKVPALGLLNIGSEAKKGTPELQEAYERLLAKSKKSSSFAFAGNIEGRNVFSEKIDVLVTDGFTGNVFLKTAEGIAAMILEELEGQMKGSLAGIKQRLLYSEYPGALLCGVDGIVIKCHGGSTPQSFISSITTAARLVQHSFLDQVQKELKKLF